MQSFKTLLQPEDPSFTSSWKSFLFNVEAVKQITREIGEDLPQYAAILQAGQRWQGEGCTTGYCSRTLFMAAGVTLVSSSFLEYLNAFLFSLSLHWSLDVSQLSLPERGSDAAFQLAQLYAHEEQGMDIDTQNPNLPGESEDDVEAKMTFPWEEPEVPLPKELLTLWERSAQGLRRLDLKSLLETLPRWQQLPGRPKVNNYRSDAGRLPDKAYRLAQQQLLHLLRLQACLYMWDSASDKDAKDGARARSRGNVDTAPGGNLGQPPEGVPRHYDPGGVGSYFLFRGFPKGTGSCPWWTFWGGFGWPGGWISRGPVGVWAQDPPRVGFRPNGPRGRFLGGVPSRT